MSKFIERTRQALERGHEFYRESLHDFTLMAARALGKDESIEVEVTEESAGNPVMSFDPRKGLLSIGVDERYAEMSPQAAYGAVVRGLVLGRGDFTATEYREATLATESSLAATAKFESPSDARDMAEVIRNEAGNYAALALAALSQPRVKKALPGVGQAVLDSFRCGEDELNLADLESKELQPRLRAAWGAMVQEVLGDGLPLEDYPADWGEGIKDIAGRIREKVHEVGQSRSLQSFVNETFYQLMKQLHVEEASSKDQNGTPRHGLGTEGVGRIQSEADAQEKAEREAEQAKRDGMAGASSGVSKVEFASEQAGRGKPIEDTPLTQLIRPYLTDERRERVTGHYSGQLSQPGRIVTDLRVMSKKMIVEDLPDTMVVVLVDNSGSMGGDRWAFGTAMHDALVGALHKLEIPVCSAAYCQSSGQNITAVNAPGGTPIQLGSVTRPQGGTGDLDAIAWATNKLDDYGKTGRVVVVISDNEGPTDPPQMKRLLKSLRADIVHIDLVGQSESQFGVKAIVARHGKPEQFAEPVGKAIRTALKLGDD